jgi:hypothetical protein
MERTIDALKRKGVKSNEQLCAFVAVRLGHINMTGDYIWISNRLPVSFVGEAS